MINIHNHIHIMELIFKKAPGKEVKVPLSTANKYITKLKTHQSNEKEPEDEFSRYSRSKKDKKVSVPSFVPCTNVINIFNKYLNTDETEPMLPEVYKSMEDLREQVVQSYRIGWDIAMIRNAIFAANGIAGIDYILSKIDQLNIMKSDIQIILKKRSGRTDPEIEFALYKKAMETKDETPESVTIDLWDKDDMDETIKKINRQINELELQRDKLNAETIVTLYLSGESSEVLGI